MVEKNLIGDGFEGERGLTRVPRPKIHLNSLARPKLKLDVFYVFMKSEEEVLSYQTDVSIQFEKKNFRNYTSYEFF